MSKAFTRESDGEDDDDEEDEDGVRAEAGR